MPETFTGADIATAAEASTSSAVSTPAPETTAAVSPDPSTTASASAPTTAAPGVDDDLTDSQLTGTIPAERVKRALANREKKTQERLEKAWQETHRTALDRDREYSADPVAYAMRTLQQLEADPQHGLRLRSEAARILGTRRAQQPVADPMPEPDVPTVDANGHPGQLVYSAAQGHKLREWERRQVKQELLQELAPLREAHARAEQERAYQAEQTRADQFAGRTMDTVDKLPGFKEHAKTILERYAALPVVRDPQTGQMVPDPNDPRTEDRKLLDIYHEVVLPTFLQSSQQSAVQTLQHKARATTLNPAGGSAAEPFDHKKATWAESFAYEAKKRGFAK